MFEVCQNCPRLEAKHSVGIILITWIVRIDSLYIVLLHIEWAIYYRTYFEVRNDK